MDFREMMALERERRAGDARYNQGYSDGVAYALDQFNAWVARGSGDGTGQDIGALGKSLEPACPPCNEALSACMCDEMGEAVEEDGLPTPRAEECAEECSRPMDEPACRNEGICARAARRQFAREKSESLPETRAIECARECIRAVPCQLACSLSEQRQAERDAVNAGAAELADMVNGNEGEELAPDLPEPRAARCEHTCTRWRKHQGECGTYCREIAEQRREYTDA